MNEEYIKEITVVSIEKGLITKKANSEEMAIEIANFINKLRSELSN